MVYIYISLFISLQIKSQKSIFNKYFIFQEIVLYVLFFDELENLVIQFSIIFKEDITSVVNSPFSAISFNPSNISFAVYRSLGSHCPTIKKCVNAAITSFASLFPLPFLPYF